MGSLGSIYQLNTALPLPDDYNAATKDKNLSTDFADYADEKTYCNKMISNLRNLSNLRIILLVFANGVSRKWGKWGQTHR